MRIYVISLLFVWIASFVIAQPLSDTERTKGWQSDIDTLLSYMKRQHYVYKSKPLPTILITKAAELKGSVDQFSDERMAFELKKIDVPYA